MKQNNEKVETVGLHDSAVHILTAGGLESEKRMTDWPWMSPIGGLPGLLYAPRRRP